MHGSAAGGQGAAAPPPDFGETYFNTIHPQILAGFCRQNNNLEFYLKRIRKIRKFTNKFFIICSKFSQIFQKISKILNNSFKFFLIFYKYCSSISFIFYSIEIKKIRF